MIQDLIKKIDEFVELKDARQTTRMDYGDKDWDVFFDCEPNFTTETVPYGDGEIRQVFASYKLSNFEVYYKTEEDRSTIIENLLNKHYELA